MTAQELKPCPFCGGRAEFDEHDEECYFTKLRALKKSKDPADMNPIMELIPAWNRRQPVARTPLSEVQRRALEICKARGSVIIASVQREMGISWDAAYDLCQSLVDFGGLTDELGISPMLDQYGITQEKRG